MSVKKYRKNPVVIEAIKYDLPLSEMIEALLIFGLQDVRIENAKIVIPTLEGDVYASQGDYIIKGVKNEFYPCKEDIFNLTYEEVKDE